MQQPAPAPNALPDYASWLTTDGVASALGVSSVVVNAWIVTGIRVGETGRLHLRAVKVGGRWKVNPEWVTEWIAATTAAALPQSATAAPAPTAVPPALSKLATARERSRRAAESMARMRARGLVATDPN